MSAKIMQLVKLRFNELVNCRISPDVTSTHIKSCEYPKVCSVRWVLLWWPGLKNSPTVTHACRKRSIKWVPSAWGYSWATLSPGVINTEVWSSRLGVGGWTNNPAPRKGYMLRNPIRGGQGPFWAVEPYDDDDYDEYWCFPCGGMTELVVTVAKQRW
jgi:hypothetical protein